MWQSDEGLPHNTVRAIAQTPDGFLWVGTEKGLARFDGHRFTLIGDQFPPLQDSRMINALLATIDGALWIGTEGGGLVEWKNGQCQRFFGNTQLPGSRVRSLAQAKDGTLWIGTDQGLASLKGTNLSTVMLPVQSPDVAVNAIAQDQRGLLRLSTRLGLLTLKRDNSFLSDNAGIGPVSYGLRMVYADRDGNLWFGGPGGLRYVKTAEEAPAVRATDLLQQVITAMLQDNTGDCWMGTARGVVRMSGEHILGWPMNEAGFGDFVNTIFEDREGNLWVGGRDGLYRIKPARFTSFAEKDGLTANDARCITEDAYGSIFVASWLAGVTRIADGRVQSIRAPEGLSDDAVLSLAPARDGGLWVGMDWGRGLNKLNEQLANTLPPNTNLLSAPIRSIREDASGALWLGTGKGLNILRRDGLTTVTSTNGLPGNNVTALLEDRARLMWIGTDRGLARWDGKEFKTLTLAEGLAENYVTCLHQDAEGTLWVGTRSRGLSRFREGHFTSYSTANGLFNDEITELFEDGAGYFWITCRRGLFRVKQSEFAALDDGRQTKIHCTPFGREDGLPSVQFNGDAKPAGCKASDGRLWLPTVRGAVIVDTRIKPNPIVPKVFIQEILADRKALRTSTAPNPAVETVVIDPGTSDVEIHFTALSLQSPERNRFRYRLDEVDDDWIDAGTRRSVNYSLLRPGTYQFHVIGANNDGVWSDQEASIFIRLEPHFWQAWWFNGLVFGTAAGILVGFYRLRVRRLRDLEKLRVRIASDLHDDVGSRLTKVAMIAEHAEQEVPASDNARLHIQHISLTVREIIRAMDEIVWTINPRNDTLENFANYLFHYAKDFFQHSPVSCRLDLPAEFPHLPISTTQRHNLFMAIKEALNNVVKHSKATEARIRLTMEDGRLSVTIADNGRGMDVANPGGSGDGLRNMRERLQQIGGSLHIESAPGQGTVVAMEIRTRTGISNRTAA
ncbi:MAG: hypothetical protein RLY20_2336 [Verrucomicrobiota bacterium]|jgi:ligand-binding sensor domain-containing protein/two-component sensor histidine kinase